MNNISVEPIVNWIGTQLEGQFIPKTIEAQLRGDHPGFPAGLLVLATSDKGIPRILVPRHVQYDLVTQAHLDILGILLLVHSSKENTSQLKKRVKDTKPFV